MIKKYCDINYRGYLLEIEQHEYIPGKFSYRGSSRDITNPAPFVADNLEII